MAEKKRYYQCLGCKVVFSRETYKENNDRCPKCSDSFDYCAVPWSRIRKHAKRNGIDLPATPVEGEFYENQ